MPERDTIARFSNRVENYSKYRPHYPAGMLDFLKEKFEIRNSMTIADIGSGTGISSIQFVEDGFRVYGIEPNDDMRKAAEHLFRNRSNFISLSGTAENTGLTPESVDLIVAGQAFHWFDTESSRREFRKILRPPGNVFLIWNKKGRKPGFMESYFGLLEKYGTDYNTVKHENYEDQEIADFFSGGRVEKFTLQNKQKLNYEGIEGRLLSSSYIPLSGDKYEQMLSELKRMYGEYEVSGLVELEYDTVIYAGCFWE
jgi:SAM-dependent methyltransferase